MRPGGRRAAAGSAILGAGLAGSLTSSHCGTVLRSTGQVSGYRQGCGRGDRGISWENEVRLGTDCPLPKVATGGFPADPAWNQRKGHVQP